MTALPESLTLVKRLVYPILGLVVLGCAATSSSSSPEDAWSRLVERRSAFQGARSYMKVRVRNGEGRWRFNARVLVDEKGRMVMTGLSPMGTAAFTLNVGHDRVVLHDHTENTVWQGSPADLPEILGIEGSFSTRLLPYLIFALPPEAVGGEIVERMGSYVRVRSGRAWLVVGRSGPVETKVVERGHEIRASYSLPSSPPTAVTIETGAAKDQRVEITHLDLSFTSTVVPPVEIEPSYRRITTP